MARTRGVAEAATRSLLKSIRRSLIHCGSMYVKSGSRVLFDVEPAMPHNPRLKLPSIFAAILVVTLAVTQQLSAQQPATGLPLPGPHLTNHVAIQLMVDG